ncbi:MAG: hypothetical protein ACMUJM_13440 [bacterium]
MGWRLMDQAMKKMRHIAHFAEPIAEDGGRAPSFKAGTIITHDSMETALKKAVADLGLASERHRKMQDSQEVKKRSGLVINLDMTVQQEAYQEAEIKDWLR